MHYQFDSPMYSYNLSQDSDYVSFTVYTGFFLYMYAFHIFTGWILIDRNGRHFGPILNFLRDGSIPLPETRRELQELLQEAKYYLVQDLVHLVEAALSNLDKSVEPVCKVPLITSHREEQHLISSTQKVHRPHQFTFFVKWIEVNSLCRVNPKAKRETPPCPFLMLPNSWGFCDEIS